MPPYIYCENEECRFCINWICEKDTVKVNFKGRCESIQVKKVGEMRKKRYRSIYDALDDVLMGCMDTGGVKSAKDKYQEKKAAPPKHYATMEEVLDPSREKLKKLQAIIDNPAATQGEKDNAKRIIGKIKSRG